MVALVISSDDAPLQETLLSSLAERVPPQTRPSPLPQWDDPSFDAQRRRARRWLTCQRHRKTVNYQFSAYDLKHAAEGHWPSASYVGYVGTHALLTEAPDCGFLIIGEGPSAHLNIASPLVLPPGDECFCTSRDTPTQICKTCVRERSAKFINSPSLWRRLKRERTAADAAEFARRCHVNDPLSDEENSRWPPNT